MWSEVLPSGKIRFVERYTDPLTLKLHRVSCTMSKDTNSTRKQAQAILNEKIEQKLDKISMSAAVRKENLRLGQLCTIILFKKLLVPPLLIPGIYTPVTLCAVYSGTIR